MYYFSVNIVILIVLVQITYRRKKISSDISGDNDTAATNRRIGRRQKIRRPEQSETYGFFQRRPIDEEAETSTLIT